MEILLGEKKLLDYLPSKESKTYKTVFQIYVNLMKENLNSQEAAFIKVFRFLMRVCSQIQEDEEELTDEDFSSIIEQKLYMPRQLSLCQGFYFKLGEEKTALWNFRWSILLMRSKIGLEEEDFSEKDVEVALTNLKFKILIPSYNNLFNAKDFNSIVEAKLYIPRHLNIYNLHYEKVRKYYHGKDSLCYFRMSLIIVKDALRNRFIIVKDSKREKELNKELDELFKDSSLDAPETKRINSKI